MARGEEERNRFPEEEFNDQVLTLRNIIDSTSAIIFSVDQKYCYTHFNQKHAMAMKNIYGKEIEIGHNILDYMALEKDREKAKINFDRALAGEQFIESNFSGGEGLSRSYFEVTHCPTMGKDGYVSGVVVISNDVTTRKQAEIELENYRTHLSTLVQQRTEQLQESEKFYRIMFEDMNTAILIVDAQTAEIVDANPAACNFYGYLHDDIVKKNISEINTISLEQIRAEIECVRTKEKFYFNYHHRLASGEIRDVEVYSCLITIDGKQLIFSIIHDNTERKWAEEQLRKFSQLVEQNPSSIIITNTDGLIEYVNPKFTELTGYSLEEVVGKNPRILKTGYTSPEEYKILWKTITSGATWQGMFRNRKKNGEEYWETASISPVVNEEGTITHFVATIVNITDRKLAEEALDHERRLLRTVIDNIPDQIFAHDRDCRFILNNLSDAKVMGVSTPADLLGKSDLDFYPPELANRYQADDRHVMESNQSLSVNEEPSITKDTGQRRWVSTIKVPLHDGLGQVIGLVGIARDITERKLAEEALRISEEKYRNLFEEAIEGIAQATPDGRYINANQSFLKMFGYDSREDLINNVTDIKNQIYVDPEDRTRLLNLLANNDRIENFESQALRKDGQKIWVSMNVNAIHNQYGELDHIDSRIMDITERKEAEEEIGMANEKLISWVNDLEQRNQEAKFIRQMGDLLQVSNEPDEYYAVIKEYIPLLFPTTSGALFIINNLQSSVEAMTEWGNNLQSEKSFNPGACWALRRSQPHTGKSSTPGLNCRHLNKTFSGNYLEIPLIASGETIGVLHVEGAGDDLFSENVQDLGRTLAEHLSLSLSNLRLRETLRSQSIRDALTGLFNRRYMEESLARELPRAVRKHSPVGIVMLDIDHFKDFNDIYGHEAGDMVLRELGELLQKQIRSEDIACRFGGEEFILILPEANQEVTVKRADQIREVVKTMRLENRGQSLGVISVSIGVAIYPNHSSTSEGILKKADEALYRAKHNGRDRVEVALSIIQT
jgi:diguanylate cyclase (GGDEF)-like protein/PAS domain S-box-containing protein